MPIDFPSSPITGQQYVYGGITYAYSVQGIWTVVPLVPAMGAGFTAYKSADQTGIVSATWTKLVFGSTLYNNGTVFNTSNSRYTPANTETCLIASVACEGTLTGSNVYLAIYKNGTLLHFGTGIATNATAQITCVDMANGTDYYEAWVYAYTASGTYSVLTGQNDVTYFQGFPAVGSTGLQGPQGPPGTNGANGSTSISGTPVAGQIAWFTDATTIQGVDLSPIGSLIWWPKSNAPPHYLKANGATYSATTYAALFAALVKQATVTMTSANPCVVTWTGNTLAENDPIKFTTTGALPTNVGSGTTRYVKNLSGNTFNLSATPGGTNINSTTGTQSGVHKGINAEYGCANDLSTFNVPDLRGEFLARCRWWARR